MKTQLRKTQAPKPVSRALKKGRNSHRNKRSRDEIDSDRVRISQLALMGFDNSRKIREALLAEGRKLSTKQVQTDLRFIRQSWLDSQHEDYDLLMNQEVSRIDALEAELWRLLRLSSDGMKSTTVEKVRARLNKSVEDDEDEDVRMVIDKITETISGKNSVSVGLLTRIADAQKERRRLLGLYAPAQIGIQLGQTIVVKGYETVSPDDWPAPMPALDRRIAPQQSNQNVVEGSFEENS